MITRKRGGEPEDSESTVDLAPANRRWPPDEARGLAKPTCLRCSGLGLCPTYGGKSTPCHCVFRAVFRACHARFLECAAVQRCSQASLDRPRLGRSWAPSGFKNEEYIADFCLVSRRSLDDFQFRLFKFHFLLGADSKDCCRQLGINRDAFFRAVYRIQQTLGRVFRELEPHALYPLHKYFNDRSSAFDRAA